VQQRNGATSAESEDSHSFTLVTKRLCSYRHVHPALAFCFYCVGEILSSIFVLSLPFTSFGLFALLYCSS